MKTIAYALSLILCAGAISACNQQPTSDSDMVLAESNTAPTQQRDPNPTNDPEVAKGYEDHQTEHRQKDTTEQYTVHKTGEGHGGVPTSGNYPPPNGIESAQ